MQVPAAPHEREDHQRFAATQAIARQRDQERTNGCAGESDCNNYPDLCRRDLQPRQIDAEQHPDKTRPQRAKDCARVKDCALIHWRLPAAPWRRYAMRFATASHWMLLKNASMYFAAAAP
jgi:hypothetical protein